MDNLRRPNDPFGLAGEIARLESHSVNSVAYSPDGRFILAGGDGICVWDDYTLNELYSIKTSGETIGCVAFSPDSRYFISGGSDGLVRLWDLEKRKEILKYDHGDGVDSVAFSPDGLCILAGGQGRRGQPGGFAALRIAVRTRTAVGPFSDTESAEFPHLRLWRPGNNNGMFLAYVMTSHIV